MKRYIQAAVLLSLFGAFVSGILLYQHFAPDTDFGIISCGTGIVNPCVTLNQSGFSVMLGIPVAALGLVLYLIIAVTGLVVMAAGEKYHRHCFAALLPISAASILADVILGSILIYLRVACRFCITTYIVNILLAINIFIWYVQLKEETTLPGLYRALFAFIRSKEERKGLLWYALMLLFMISSVLAGSAYLGARARDAMPGEERIKKFAEFFYSIPQENLLLPESPLFCGEPNAPVRIIAFTDFLCSACFRLYEADQKLLSRFPGRIRIDYYAFPLDAVCNGHSPRTVYPNSCVASRAFLAASKNGIFRDLLEYHYGHYRENHARLASGDALAAVKNYFSEQGAAAEGIKFFESVRSDPVNRMLKRDVDLGGTLAIRSVPTLFINGRRLEGVPDYGLLEWIIDRELEKN